MKRGIVDLSSVLWTSLRVGKDKEHGYEEEFEGKNHWINSAAYGYANAVSHLLACMKEFSMQPRQLIFVQEGMNAKSARQAIYPAYKAGAGKAPAWYTEFNKAKEMLLSTFLGLGSQLVWQDGLEADDVVGYLAKNLKGERWVFSNDKDLAQVIDPDNDAHLYRLGVRDENPFGPFDVRYIPVAIALLGDTSDGIPGVKGFGEKAFEKLLILFGGDDGLAAFQQLLERRELNRLAEDVGEMKELQKVIDQADNAYLSYHLAKLRIDKVNTLQNPLKWQVGMVKPKAECFDPALRHYGGQSTLVHAGNYEEAMAFLRRHLWSSPEFAFDIETSTPPESDEWLEMQDKEEGGTVDVFGSELTGFSLTFGPNMQYTYYVTVDHVEEDDVKNITVAQARDMVGEIPREKVTWVHNASFELPVCYNAWGEDWKDDPEYHGFLRNVRDTAIASSYVDENESRGLKKLSSRLLGYEQTSYEQVTTKDVPKSDWDGTGRLVGEYDEVEGAPATVRVQFKMNQLKAREVVGYGADDAIVTAALANHFVTVMEIENTFDVFEQVETFPAYVTALGFVQGVDFDLEGMFAMEREDDEAYEKAWATLRQFLMDIGYDGTKPPVFEEMTPAAIKEAHLVCLGQELKTLVKTPSKLAKLILQSADAGEYEDEERARTLATVIEAGDPQRLTAFTQQYFVGEPVLDLNSPKQMKRFLYDIIGMPVEMTNDLTPLERKHNPALKEAIYRHRKVRQGKAPASSLSAEDIKLLRTKAKTDEKAINFALAFHAEQIEPAARTALKALQAMKKVMTRRSLFYNKYRRIRHWKDGKIHAQMNQCAAVTRRYSSSDPNLQQLPKKGEAVRFRAFILPHHKDAVVCSIDFAGQELRLAAERSQDANMLACYVGDKLKDIHSITAAGAMKLKWGAAAVKELYGRWGQDLQEGMDYDLFMRLRSLEKKEPMKKQADDLRKDSKNVNFAAQFGGQAVKLSETLIMPVSDAQLFLDARSAMFPDVDKAAKRAADFAERHGYALTLMGARRHLRNSIMSEDRSEVSAALRQAWNMEIQGSAGEMTKMGMTRIWKSGALHRFDVRFIAPIHDELVTSVHRDHAAEFIRIKHEAMTQPYATMKVPVVGSISLGRNFAEQIECGEEFDAKVIAEAVNDAFGMKEAA